MASNVFQILGFKIYNEYKVRPGHGSWVGHSKIKTPHCALRIHSKANCLHVPVHASDSDCV